MSACIACRARALARTLAEAAILVGVAHERAGRAVLCDAHAEFEQAIRASIETRAQTEAMEGGISP